MSKNRGMNFSSCYTNHVRRVIYFCALCLPCLSTLCMHHTTVMWIKYLMLLCAGVGNVISASFGQIHVNDLTRSTWIMLRYRIRRKKHRAAVMIQTMARKHYMRKLLRESVVGDLVKRRFMARKIQNNWRAHLARKEKRKLMLLHKIKRAWKRHVQKTIDKMEYAAIMIQSRFKANVFSQSHLR